ncbi:LptF/LptG family permease [bacterium]|nr:LptF/LptG family permease [bacterium]
MKTLSKYTLREHLQPFLGGFIIIMFVMVMDFILDILNLILAKGVDPFTVLKLFILNLSWMLALAVPMSCLIAGLMAFGRLSQDGEITATVSSGVPLIRIMLAPMIVALLISFGMVYFSDQILPDLNHEAKLLIGDIKRKKPTLAIKERVFIDDFPGVGMFIQDVDERTNKLEGITIYDQKERRYPRIITAERGKMYFDKDADVLNLELINGSIHEIDETDPSKYTQVNFESQTMRFGNLGMNLERRDTGHRGDRELKIADMKELIITKKNAIIQAKRNIVNLSDRAFNRALIPAENPKKDILEAIESIRSYVKSTSQSISSQLNAIQAHQRYVRKYTVEINKKITLPLACFFFLFVGAPVGVWARKGGMGVAIGFGLFFFVTYWALLIGGEELADRGFVAPWLSMWIPNFVLGAIGCSILYRTIWSSRFSGFGFLVKLIDWLKGFFTRKRKFNKRL